MSTRLSPAQFKSIFGKVPRLCVELVIKNQNGTLLTLRKIEPFRGMWHLPGGSVLIDESVLDAINRVASIELGVSVTNPKPLGYIDWFDTTESSQHVVSLVFQVTPKSYDFKLDYQASEYQFFQTLPENTIHQYLDFFKSLKS